MNAHPDIIKLAGHIYDEYSRAVGGVNFKGEPLPDWHTFSSDPSKQKQADGWIAVANCAQNYLQGPQ